VLTDANLDQIVNGDRGMLRGIEVCLREQCLMSAVTLMFAAIDALAALTRPPAVPETTGDIFQAWVTRFMPMNRMGCTALELWGARCGVLHTHRPEARVVQGAVLPLYYQWRAGPPAAAERALPARHRVIVIEDLYEALRQATNAYLEATTRDPALAASLQAHLPNLLSYRPFAVD
jgi:hypothetical protein